ncbi:MAG: hypothetical protein ABJB03_10130 [Rhodoglobus sp.]
MSQSTVEERVPGAQEDNGRVERRLPSVWAGLAIASTVLAAAGGITGLLIPGVIYGRETPTLYDSAIAQDLVSVFLLAPVTVVLAVRAMRGSLKSWLCLLGVLAFTVYNYVIYTFSVQFGPLFLVWVAILGLSVFAFVGGLAALNASPLRFDHAAIRTTGWFIGGTAALFALLWLSEIVPDLVAGRPSTSASAWNVPTNPVHVLDLALFVPGMLASAVLLMRRRQIGYATAAAILTFIGFTAMPILLTPLVANARGHEAGWAVMIPMGVVLLGTVLTLWRFLRTVGSRNGAPRDSATTADSATRLRERGRPRRRLRRGSARRR